MSGMGKPARDRETWIFRTGPDTWESGSAGSTEILHDQLWDSMPVDITTAYTASLVQIFTFTSGTQTFTVPDNVFSINAIMWAGGGGASTYSSVGGGGSSGFSSGTIAVIPGEILYIMVGEGGKAPSAGSFGIGGLGGFPGGGFGTSGDATGAGGGGYSGIFTGSVAHENAIMIAGAGGGGTGYRAGGGGGGLTGNTAPSGGPTGGTQIAGGTTGGGLPISSNGSALTGGNGRGTRVGGSDDGGGGGAGYYGGGGGFSDAFGGGGGSGYIHPTKVTGGVTIAGSDGSSTVSNPPQTSNLYYTSSIGTGAQGGGLNNGGSGLVVLNWNAEIPALKTSPIVYTTSSVSIAATPPASASSGYQRDAYFYVSGTIGVTNAARKIALFGGDVYVSGSVTGKFTGSLTATSNGLPAFVGLGGTTVTNNSLGQVVISSSIGGTVIGGGGGSVASVTASLPSSLRFSPVTFMSASANFTAFTSTGFTYTMGIQFRVLEPLTITGATMFVSETTARNFRISLWNASNTRVAVTDVAVQPGIGKQTFSFGTASYRVPEAQRGTLFQITFFPLSSGSVYLTQRTPLFSTLPIFVDPQVIYVSLSRFVLGDASPTTTAGLDLGYPIEPAILDSTFIFTGSTSS